MASPNSSAGPVWGQYRVTRYNVGGRAKHSVAKTVPWPPTSPARDRVFTLGDTRSFSGLTSKIPPLDSMLNFDADVKKKNDHASPNVKTPGDANAMSCPHVFSNAAPVDVRGDATRDAPSGSQP